MTQPSALTRRALIAAASMAAPAAQAAAKPIPAGNMPKGFLWGAATAGHQVEGNNVNSDTWLLEQLKPSPFMEPSGDACDHYHRYEADIAMLAKLGFNTYRFSLEWARIEPAKGQFSAAELEHYRRVAATCRRAWPDAGDHLQPLHRAALVRGPGRLGKPGVAGAVRALLRLCGQGRRRPWRAPRRLSTSPISACCWSGCCRPSSWTR
jgi:hypothetical protein